MRQTTLLPLLFLFATASFNLNAEVCWDSSKSEQEATEICERLAAQGKPDAQLILGRIYARGDELTLRNEKKAVELFVKSASQDWQGKPGAQTNLGMLYADKNSPLKNYAKAIEWFTLAAEKGRDGAQSSLGALYFYREGPHQNLVTGYMWYTIAVRNGSRFKLERVEKIISEEEKSQAIQLADEWEARHPCAMSKNRNSDACPRRYDVQ